MTQLLKQWKPIIVSDQADQKSPKSTTFRLIFGERCANSHSAQPSLPKSSRNDGFRPLERRASPERNSCCSREDSEETMDSQAGHYLFGTHRAPKLLKTSSLETAYLLPSDTVPGQDSFESLLWQKYSTGEENNLSFSNYLTTDTETPTKKTNKKIKNKNVLTTSMNSPALSHSSISRIPAFRSLFDHLMNSKPITLSQLQAAKSEIFSTAAEPYPASESPSSLHIFLLVLDNKFYSAEKRKQHSFTMMKDLPTILEKLTLFLSEPHRMKDTKRRKNEEYRKKIFKAFVNDLHEQLGPRAGQSKKQRTKELYKEYHRDLIRSLVQKYDGNLRKFAKDQGVFFEEENHINNIDIDDNDSPTPESLCQLSRHDFSLPGQEFPLESAFAKIYFTYVS